MTDEKAEPRTVKVDQVAEALAISDRRVQQLVKEGMPQVARGKYELDACMRWYIRFLQKALEQRSSVDGEQVSNLTSERIRAARAQTSRFELENARIRGEVVPVKYMAEILFKLSAELASRLESIPGRVQTQLKTVIDDPGATRQLLQKECRTVRNACADILRHFSERNPGVARRGEDLEASASAKRNGVGARVSNSPRRSKRRAGTV